MSSLPKIPLKATGPRQNTAGRRVQTFRGAIALQTELFSPQAFPQKRRRSLQISQQRSITLTTGPGLQPIKARKVASNYHSRDDDRYILSCAYEGNDFGILWFEDEALTIAAHFSGRRKPISPWEFYKFTEHLVDNRQRGRAAA